MEILTDLDLKGNKILNADIQLDNIEIGVRNIIQSRFLHTKAWRDSIFDYEAVYKGKNCIKVNHQTLYNNCGGGKNIFPEIVFEQGQYILQIEWADGDESTTAGNMKLRFRYSDSSTEEIACDSKNWTHKILISNPNKTIVGIDTSYGSRNTNTYISKIKLEKGNQITGFTNALEDYMNEINSNNWNENYNHIKEYRKEALSNMASYLMKAYNSSCVKGYTGDQIVFKYDTNKGYMGLFGRYLDFVYTDKEGTAGNRNIAYMDCAVFVSLITKCISYTNSPYHYAFTTSSPSKKELYHKSLETGGHDKPYTFDWLNNINASRMMFQSYKAGLNVYVVSSKTGNTTNYNQDVINRLESGDIIYRGVASVSDSSGQTYKNVDHTGIFVKDLNELNTADGVPAGVTFHDLGGVISKYGYIVEFTGSMDGTGYKDCLRISALERWSDHHPFIYAVKPISNIHTSNKACAQATGILHCYDYDVRVIQEMTNGYYIPCEVIPRIASGLIIKTGEDLNDYCVDGLYQCNQLSVAKTLKNTPTTTMNYDLKCIGFNKDGGYGTQIVYCNSNSQNVIYIRTCFVKGNWSPWEQLATTKNAMPTTAWTRLTTSANFITDGSKPWVNQMKKQGDVVTLNLDVTLKYQLATGKQWLGLYQIPTHFKPSHLWKECVYTEQGKRVFLEMMQDNTNGLCIKISGETINAGDRIRTTFTYMV